MRNVGRFFALALAIMLLIGISKVCSGEAAKEEKLKDQNTQIALKVEGFESEEWNSEEYLNSINIGFKNTGSEDIIKVTCKIHFFGVNDNEIGVLNFEYDIYDGNDKKSVKPNESTYLYHKTLHTSEKAVRYTVTDLKVNGRNRQSNYN